MYLINVDQSKSAGKLSYFNDEVTENMPPAAITTPEPRD
jgi:hypothetical protein